MNALQSLDWPREAKRLGLSLLGAFIYAVGINMFVVPSGLYTGGVLGMCQVIRTVLVDRLQVLPASFDIAGILYYAINIPLLIAAWFVVERRFVLRTVITVTAITLFLSLIPTRSLLEGDTLTGCFVGGVIAGAGAGLTLRGGATTGGTDILGMMLLRKGSHISVGRISLSINVLLYLCCLVLFNVRIAIYSIVYSAIFNTAVDKLHFQNILEEVIVITKQPVEEMEAAIFHEMNRGLTKIDARGGYTDEPVTMLYIVVSKDEGPQLRSIIMRHDPKAFVTVQEHADVYGNFTKRI